MLIKIFENSFSNIFSLLFLTLSTKSWDRIFNWTEIFLARTHISLILSLELTNFKFISKTFLSKLNNIFNKAIAIINSAIKTIDIKNQHLSIQKLQFKNKALSCGTFNKKYTYMKKNKYAGVPIGEYMCGNDEKNIDLNVVFKDLNATLT